MHAVITTPHAHAQAGGYVIGADVHIYVYIYSICLWTKKIFESYFSD